MCEHTGIQNSLCEFKPPDPAILVSVNVPEDFHEAVLPKVEPEHVPLPPCFKVKGWGLLQLPNKI